MKTIGIISDTHGYLHPGISEKLTHCDEIWHAGDVGSSNILKQLQSHAPVKAVYGNIDGTEIRGLLPEYQYFSREGFSVFIIHIGGYPGKYAPGVKKLLEEKKPAIMIAGHSHILKIIYDKNLNLLHINPGASGRTGLHQVITMVKLTLDDGEIKDSEIIEFPRR